MTDLYRLVNIVKELGIYHTAFINSSEKQAERLSKKIMLLESEYDILFKKLNDIIESNIVKPQNITDIIDKVYGGRK